MAFLPTDKIRVFVSSTISECKEERDIARKAIDSLNHLPILFEAAGARPYPPRSVYLRGLENSQIFIGIYKEKYGFIAADMAISGVEDEFRYAIARGLPPLFYVKRSSSREPRLENLLSEIKGPDFTVGSYEHPSELYDLLRDDIAALVAEYVHGGLAQSSLLPISPGRLLDQLVPINRRVRRAAAEVEFIATLTASPAVLVRGPMGAGKTVFLAGLADSHGWLYVQAGDRIVRDIVSEAANAIRSRLKLPATSFNQSDEAARALTAAWQALSEVTLVLDDVRDVETLEIFKNLLTVC